MLHYKVNGYVKKEKNLWIILLILISEWIIIRDVNINILL